MATLKELYTTLKSLRDMNLPVDDKLLKAADNLEEKIIKEEILPALSQNIEPQLSEIQRDLVLVVEYHPGEPLSVALSRKTKISEIIDAKTLTPKSSKPVSSSEKPASVEPHVPTKHIENPTKGLRVTFPDGTVIWHKQAIDTFINTLRKIGLNRVAEMGIKHGGGYDLVSKDKRPTVPGRIWQHECDGWYIYSNMSNSTKAEDLKLISGHYKLGLIIEEGKPTGESFTQISTIDKDMSSPSGAILITSQNAQEVQGRDMRITVNGKVFQERNAIQTFIEALKFIGLDEVAKVGIMCSGYNLVDTRQRLDGGRRWQQQEGDKWVYVYFSNITKVNYLMQIADFLKVNIKIEAI